jgi:hypothetical protein
MAALKTVVNDADVEGFLKGVEPPERREDGLTLLKMMQKATGEKPKMWGTSIVGFGTYHYKSERSRQEGDWMVVGFSPRKANLTLYSMQEAPDAEELLAKLGKHTLGGGCLYIKRLSDIDQAVLTKLVKSAYTRKKKMSEA